MSEGEKTDPTERKLLERRANVVRSRLLRTIDALDSRRHQVQAVGHEAKKIALPVAASFFGVAVLTFGVVLGIRSMVRRRRSPISVAVDRWRAPKRPSVFEEVGRKALAAVVTIVSSEIARRTMKNVLDGRVGAPEGARP